MPYIKKISRPPFDEILSYVGQEKQPFDPITQAVSIIMSLEPTERDGCLNYMFSKLLKDEKNPETYHLFVTGVLDGVYLSPPKYWKWNALKGLLSSMIDEFLRREWSKKSMGFLGGLYRYYKSQANDYERQKQEENGDI